MDNMSSPDPLQQSVLKRVDGRQKKKQSRQRLVANGHHSIQRMEPILGYRRVRKIVLAASFPEFYTAAEVDALHDLLDVNCAAQCHFFGNLVIPEDPHFYRIRWRLHVGHYEAVRWVGSRFNAAPGAPWWAGSAITGLMNEMPEEYDDHID
ncbi:hypothetical protein BT69DRAFT_1325937, partial [Atractiella rhizophila]